MSPGRGWATCCRTHDEDLGPSVQGRPSPDQRPAVSVAFRDQALGWHRVLDQLSLDLVRPVLGDVPALPALQGIRLAVVLDLEPTQLRVAQDQGRQLDEDRQRLGPELRLVELELEGREQEPPAVLIDARVLESGRGRRAAIIDLRRQRRDGRASCRRSQHQAQGERCNKHHLYLPRYP